MERNQVDIAEVRRMMRGVSYFADLGEGIFDNLMQGVQVQYLPAGQTIFLMGEGSNTAPFYLVIRGQVRVYLSSLRGREQVLRHFGPGDTFGEVPLFDGGPYPASADALTDVVLAMLPRQQILGLMETYPALAARVVAVMAGRLRHFNALIEDLSLRRVISRVARLLTDEQSSELTQTQMAAMIGASREMVNRSLHRLEDERIIELSDDGSITVLAPDRLRQTIDEV